MTIQSGTPGGPGRNDTVAWKTMPAQQGAAAHGVEGVQAFAAGCGHGSDCQGAGRGVRLQLSMHQQV